MQEEMEFFHDHYKKDGRGSRSLSASQKKVGTFPLFLSNFLRSGSISFCLLHLWYEQCSTWIAESVPCWSDLDHPIELSSSWSLERKVSRRAPWNIKSICDGCIYQQVDGLQNLHEEVQSLKNQLNGMAEELGTIRGVSPVHSRRSLQSPSPQPPWLPPSASSPKQFASEERWMDSPVHPQSLPTAHFPKLPSQAARRPRCNII